MYESGERLNDGRSSMIAFGLSRGDTGLSFNQIYPAVDRKNHNIDQIYHRLC
jgi:hypothetical protein